MTIKLCRNSGHKQMYFLTWRSTKIFRDYSEKAGYWLLVKEDFSFWYYLMSFLRNFTSLSHKYQKILKFFSAFRFKAFKFLSKSQDILKPDQKKHIECANKKKLQEVFSMNDFDNRNNIFSNDTQNSHSLQTQGIGTSTSYYSEDNNPKPKGNKTTKIIAAAMVCSIVLSGAAGFGGGLLAARFSEGEEAPSTVSNLSSSVSSSMSGSLDPVNATNVVSTAGAMTTAQIAAATANSVVEITTESVVTGGGFWVQQYVASGAGSGVILSEDGYIVTNNHVIEDATSVTVRLHSGESYEAQIVGADSEKDVALLKIEASGLSPAVIGNSDNLVVGEETVAVGNPLGQLGGTVTNGIVSALDREITIDGQSMNLLQTNAAINPGNSGGGLFNEKGELVGLVVAKSAGSDLEGLGFAIPVNDVMDVVEQLKEFGYVTGKPYLGISLLDIDTVQKAMRYGVSRAGVYVAEVEREESGLKPGDCIVQINGLTVESGNDVSQTIKNYSAGDTVDMTVIRDGETVEVKALLGEKVPQSVQQKEENVFSSQIVIPSRSEVNA